MGVNIEGSLVQLRGDSGKEAAEKIFRVHLELLDDSENAAEILSQSYDDVISVFEHAGKALIIPGRDRSIMMNLKNHSYKGAVDLRDYTREAKCKATAFIFSDTAAAYEFIWFDDWIRTKKCEITLTQNGFQVTGNDVFNLRESKSSDVAMELYPEWVEKELATSWQDIEKNHSAVYKVVREWREYEHCSDIYLLKSLAKSYHSENSVELRPGATLFDLLGDKNRRWAECDLRGLSPHSFSMDLTEVYTWSDAKLLSELQPLVSNNLPESIQEQMRLFVLMAECKKRHWYYRSPFKFYDDLDRTRFPFPFGTKWENWHHSKADEIWQADRPVFKGGNQQNPANYEGGVLPKAIAQLVEKEKAKQLNRTYKTQTARTPRATSTGTKTQSTDPYINNIDNVKRGVWIAGVIFILGCLLYIFAGDSFNHRSYEPEPEQSELVILSLEEIQLPTENRRPTLQDLKTMVRCNPDLRAAYLHALDSNWSLYKNQNLMGQANSWTNKSLQGNVTFFKRLASYETIRANTIGFADSTATDTLAIGHYMFDDDSLRVELRVFNEPKKDKRAEEPNVHRSN